MDIQLGPGFAIFLIVAAVSVLILKDWFAVKLSRTRYLSSQSGRPPLSGEEFCRRCGLNPVVADIVTVVRSKLGERRKCDPLHIYPEDDLGSVLPGSWADELEHCAADWGITTSSYGDTFPYWDVRSVADFVGAILKLRGEPESHAGANAVRLHPVVAASAHGTNARVAEETHPVLMGILALLMTLGAWILYALFSSEGWTTARVIGQVAFIITAIGLYVATASQTLGLRIVAFVIFAGYLCVLIAEFVIEARPVAITGGTKFSPVGALLGFLSVGIPCLLYSMRGFTRVRPVHDKPAGAKRAQAVAYLAWGAHMFFLALSALVSLAVLWKWLAS